MNVADVKRAESVNFWSTKFQKKESFENNIYQVSLFTTPEKKFKNTSISSALAGNEGSNSTSNEKENNPEPQDTNSQNKDLNLEPIRFFKFGSLY